MTAAAPVRLTGLIANVILFQAAWLVTVWGVAHDLASIGLAAVALVIAVHLALARDRRAALRLIGAATVLGLIVESGLAASGLVAYGAPGPVPGLAPFWLAGLWSAFATLPNVSLVWLHGRPGLAACIGAAFGPVAYLAGERLGAMSISTPKLLGIGVIALIWAVALPALMALASRTR